MGASALPARHRVLREVLPEDQAAPSFKEFLASMPDVGLDEDFAQPRDLPGDVSG